MNSSSILKAGYSQRNITDILKNKLLNLYNGKILKIFDTCYFKEIEEYSLEFDGNIIETVYIFKIKSDYGKIKFIAVKDKEAYEIKNAEEIPSASKEFLDYGFVYIVKSELGCKIGRTKNLDDRMNLFNVKLPFNWEITKTYLLKDYKDFEKFFHSKFNHKRINGEWFDLSNEDLELIDKFYNLIIHIPQNP